MNTATTPNAGPKLPPPSSKSQQFKEAAARAEAQLRAEYEARKAGTVGTEAKKWGAQAPEPTAQAEPTPAPEAQAQVEAKETVDAAPVGEPQAEVEIESEAKTSDQPASQPEDKPKVDLSKQYEFAVKGMNEAQRKAAELEKALKAREEAEKALQQRLEALESASKQAKAPQGPSLDDVWAKYEQELPDTAELVKLAMTDTQNKLGNSIQAIETRLAELKKAEEQARQEQARVARDMEIQKAHNDYYDVVNSDGFRAWVYGGAPDVFRQIFEGTIPFSANDGIALLNYYKQAVAPTPTLPTTPKQTTQKAAERSVAARPSVAPSPAVAEAGADGDVFTAEEMASIDKIMARARNRKERAAITEKMDRTIRKHQLLR